MIDLSIKIEPDPGIGTVRELMDYLRYHYQVPISFVEARPEELLDIKRSSMTLDNLLSEVAQQQSGYQCEIRRGRLIFRDKNPLFDTVISDVHVVEEYRFSGLTHFLLHLQSYPSFADWQLPWRGGNLDSPLLTEKVTLSPKAPLLDHAVRLLGQLQTAYFEIPASAGNPRTLVIQDLTSR